MYAGSRVDTTPTEGGIIPELGGGEVSVNGVEYGCCHSGKKDGEREDMDGFAESLLKSYICNVSGG